LELLILQAIPVRKVFGCPEKFLKPLVVMMKPLIRVLLGLGCEQEKWPIAPLQQKELEGHLANNAAPPLIDRFTLAFE